MTRNELITYIEANGYIQKKGSKNWYHPRSSVERFSVGKIKCNIEHKIGDTWYKMIGNYYCHLSLNDNGILKGLI